MMVPDHSLDRLHTTHSTRHHPNEMEISSSDCARIPALLPPAPLHRRAPAHPHRPQAILLQLARLRLPRQRERACAATHARPHRREAAPLPAVRPRRRFAPRWARSVGRSHLARLGRGGLTVVCACRKLAGRAVTMARHRRDTSPRTCVPSTPANARSPATCSAPPPLHLDRRHAPECSPELTALLRCCVTALQPYSLLTAYPPCGCVLKNGRAARQGLRLGRLAELAPQAAHAERAPHAGGRQAARRTRPARYAPPATATERGWETVCWHNSRWYTRSRTRSAVI